MNMSISDNSKDIMEFESIYTELQSSYRKPLEYLRNRIIVKKIFMYISLVVFLLGCLACQIGTSIKLSKETYIAIPTVTMVSCIVLACLATKQSKSERVCVALYRENILPDFVKMVENGLVYTPKPNDTEKMLERYIKPCFDVRTFNRARVNDNIDGYLKDGLKVKMSNIRLQSEMYVGDRTKTTELFYGLFVDIEGIKDIGTILKIFVEENEYCFAFGIPKQTKVEMDSLEFERKFNVYSPNKIIAMQILTSDIMEILINFRKTFGIKPEIVIDTKHIYLRFHTGALFETKLFNGKLNKNILFKYYGVLKNVTIMSKKINEAIKNAGI